MSYENVVALLNPAISAVYCVSLLVLWQHQRHLSYIAIFALSYAVRTLSFGSLYFALAHEALELRLIANALILVAMMMLSVALSSRYRERPRYGCLSIVGVVTMVALYFYQHVEPSLPARALFLNWALALVCLVMVLDALRRPQRTAVEQLFFGLVVLACIGFLIRPLVFQFSGMEVDQVEDTYWLIESISDALICTTLGVAIFAIIAVDITDGIKMEAQTDALSGLFNRRGFDTRAREALERQRAGEPVAIVLCDLDHFKSINDRFGHSVGDKIIQVFSKVLSDNAPHNAIVARQGGEEFVALLPSGQASSAHQFAEAVQVVFRDKARDILPSAFSATASFGIAIAFEGEDLRSLMNRADRALYRAKSAGRDCVTEWSSNDTGGPLETAGMPSPSKPFAAVIEFAQDELGRSS